MCWHFVLFPPTSQKAGTPNTSYLSKPESTDFLVQETLALQEPEDDEPEFVVAALVVGLIVVAGLTVVAGLVVALVVVALAGHTPPPHQHLPSPHSQQERATQAALVSLDPSQITSPGSNGWRCTPGETESVFRLNDVHGDFNLFKNFTD